ncbi:MAG: cell surface protein SprA, partial [Lewinella sp.]|nr:cell surface protein SprA [Lewinella sp.]
SNISVMAEAAAIDPGHARAINQSRKDKAGIVYIDDFEGSASSIDLRQPTNQWFLASVPQNDEQNNNPFFPESRREGLVSGANRALLNWYRIDPQARGGGDGNDTYTSLVPQEEVFPNRNVQPDQLPNVQTLDLSFFPQERGPYNFDTPNGFPGFTEGVDLVSTDTLGPVKLRAPEGRWGGIMRALTINDFQTANIEFVEFWMLSPFLDDEDADLPSANAEQRQGTLYLNLGNISEDILKDSRRFFENGLPGPANENRPVDTTTWARVPVGQQITRAFDNDPETRRLQDVGLDGFDDMGETEHYQSYLSALSAINSQAAGIVANDPANDNFVFYADGRFDSSQGVRTRYRRFNNPQGNSGSNETNNQRQSGTNIPDAEDLDNDNTLNETESYFQYEIPLRVDQLDRRRVDRAQTPYITDERVDETTGRIWYRFRVPLNGPDRKAVGGIRDFRSIRFMRMYMRGFERPTILRFASLELVRNQWRRYTRSLAQPGQNEAICDGTETNFQIDAVNIEENSNKQPFNYSLPVGIQREQSLGVFQTLQNEQSLALRIDNLCDGDSKAVFKYTENDLRVYERLQMFIHAETRDSTFLGDVPDDALRLFVRLGSDFQSNYYEYEIPLKISRPDVVRGLNGNQEQYKNEVWRPENFLNFPLAILRELKQERNDLNFDAAEEFASIYVPEGTSAEHVIKVRGNPNLGFTKVMMIGVRNPRQEEDFGAVYSIELWANELRLTGLDERGGLAALGRVDMQLADLGSVTVSGNYSSIGFGALDQGVQERAREQVTGYDLATSLELGKFLPNEWGVRLPFYAQYSNTTATPEYDPYDLDIRLKDKLDAEEDAAVRDSLREQAQEIVNITTYNFTNVRKERTGAGGNVPHPWDIENFSVSYGYTETDR